MKDLVYFLNKKIIGYTNSELRLLMLQPLIGIKGNKMVGKRLSGNQSLIEKLKRVTEDKWNRNRTVM